MPISKEVNKLSPKENEKMAQAQAQKAIDKLVKAQKAKPK